MTRREKRTLMQQLNKGNEDALHEALQHFGNEIITTACKVLHEKYKFGKQRQTDFVIELSNRLENSRRPYE